MRKMVVVCLALALVFGFAAAAGAQKAAPEKVTVTGEVIDLYCYTTAGERGMGHRACAIDCAKHGIPVGLLEKGTDKVYILLPDKKATPIPAGVINKAGEDITITGEKYLVGGDTFLTIESFK
ncbi:MAG: hypothetical protein ACLQUW_15710 [Desulfobaccales bacterium]